MEPTRRSWSQVWSAAGALVLAAVIVVGAAGAPAAGAAPRAGASPESGESPDPAPAPDPASTPEATSEPEPEPESEPTSEPAPAPDPTAAPGPTPQPAPTSSPDVLPDAPRAPSAPDGSDSAEEPPVPEADASARQAAGPSAVVPTVSRLSGPDRYATSAAASRAGFPNGAATVLIASGSAPVDGVIAAGLSAGLRAPLLLVGHTVVPDVVAAEIARLAPASIVVIGGEPSVSAAVLDRLRAFTPDVQRFGGASRFETSLLALRTATSPLPTVYIAGGLGLIDAPFASVAAAATGGGALLVDERSSAVDAPTLDALRAVGATSVVIVGGTGGIGPGFEQSLRDGGFAVSRRAGVDRYDTAILMSREGPATRQRAIVANSASSPDVAVAAALAAASGQPLLYAIEPCVPDPVAAHLASVGWPITAVGGPEWLGAVVPVNRSCSAERQQRQSALEAALRGTLSAYNNGAGFSVSVREVGGLGQYVQIGGGVRREPASMIKLFAAWAVGRIIDEGRAHWGTRLPSGVSLADCVHVMIHASDNYCHTDIVHWIGIGELNRMIAAAGFCCTTYGNVNPPTSVLYAGNRTTTDDLVHLLTRLHNGTALSKANGDHILGLMKAQVFRTRLASGIPPGVGQASKPGALWLTSGLLQADSAIVWGPKTTYIVSVIGDQGPPQEALRRVSRTVYEHFHGPFGAAAVYPVEQTYAPWPIQLLNGPNGSPIGYAPTGALIQVLDAQRVWYSVRYGGRDVWTHFTNLRNR
ncbi:serine hydrolase [Microbacterium sp. BK668]|uniref:serine hydrolase n=1 Tax=Microbacterium sp. BK668 TaxID=2512118 RepID=UPI001061C8D9|nr:serine hydrolase [Microbacterium sp. BK668]TDN87861.1 putative cell wall binding repeat protein [Microbacterium sp. BK668]